MKRYWRDEAIGWFDALERIIGSHFDPSRLAELRKTLDEGNRSEIDELRKTHLYLHERADVFARMHPIDRPVDGDWEFVATYHATFAAIFALALEDFR